MNACLPTPGVHARPPPPVFARLGFWRGGLHARVFTRGVQLWVTPRGVTRLRG